VDSWAYGLVELEIKDKSKGLTLCEVYFNKKSKIDTFVPVEWKELKVKKERYLVINDILRQLESNIKFYAKQNKKGEWKIWQTI
jgi:hypothetical protein